MPQLKIQVRAARDKLITQAATVPCPYDNYTTTSGSEQPLEQNNVSQQQIQPPQSDQTRPNMPVQSNTTNPNNSNNPALNEAQKQAHNLTGVNGSQFNPSPSFRERSNTVPPPAPDETSQDETYDVIALNRQEQYLHARILAKKKLILSMPQSLSISSSSNLGKETLVSTSSYMI